MRAWQRRLAATLGSALLPVAGAASAGDDLTDLSLEELMQIRVYAASKFDQETAHAPASVTVITADQIRAFGYRTLADVLKSVRGLYASYDRNYAYLGVRGFERPGDYDSRVLLLADGHRLNDTIYDTAGIGTEFPVDMDLVDRIEIVRGPGSAIHGSNAFFAVINVITRRGRDVGTLEASAEAASWGTDRERLATGGRSEAGLEWLVSASRYRSQGQDLYFPAYDSPSTNDGRAEGLDGDAYEKAFAKLAAGDLTLTLGHSRRDKDVPTAAYGAVFNDPRFQTTDQWQYANVDYRYGFGAWELVPSLSYGRYRYGGEYPFDYPPVTMNRDRVAAQWWATEVRLLGRFERHSLVSGLEYQQNFQQDQLSYDVDPYVSYLDDRRRSDRGGVYLEDEFAIAQPLRINAGLRFDHYSTAGDALSPRLAVIWSPLVTTTLKAIAGTAYRAPNSFELYYGASNITFKANPDLEPERIHTYELVAEHYLDPNFRVTADAYLSRIRSLIDQVTDPSDGSLVFRNGGRVRGDGVELELERLWSGDARLGASYAWQETRDEMTGATLGNSPRHLAKFNLALPVVTHALLAGTELQYMSSRETLAGARTGAAVVANLTLTSRLLADRLEISGSVYNLFDREYSDPARPEHEPTLDQIRQDGRNYRIGIGYRF